MSLADYYKQTFGEAAPASEQEKTAEAKQIESILSDLSEEECEKLGHAVDALEAEGLEYATGADKLAAAAELVDETDADETEETNEAGEVKKEASEEAATEWEAAGRIMARAFDSELSSIDMEKDAAKGKGKAGAVSAWMSKMKRKASKKGATAMAFAKKHKGKGVAGAAGAAAGGLAGYMAGRRKKD